MKIIREIVEKNKLMDKDNFIIILNTIINQVRSEEWGAYARWILNAKNLRDFLTSQQDFDFIFQNKDLSIMFILLLQNVSLGDKRAIIETIKVNLSAKDAEQFCEFAVNRLTQDILPTQLEVDSWIDMLNSISRENRTPEAQKLIEKYELYKFTQPMLQKINLQLNPFSEHFFTELDDRFKKLLLQNHNSTGVIAPAEKFKPCCYVAMMLTKNPDMNDQQKFDILMKKPKYTNGKSIFMIAPSVNDTELTLGMLEIIRDLAPNYKADIFKDTTWEGETPLMRCNKAQGNLTSEYIKIIETLPPTEIVKILKNGPATYHTASYNPLAVYDLLKAIKKLSIDEQSKLYFYSGALEHGKEWRGFFKHGLHHIYGYSPDKFASSATYLSGDMLELSARTLYFYKQLKKNSNKAENTRNFHFASALEEQCFKIRENTDLWPQWAKAVEDAKKHFHNNNEMESFINRLDHHMTAFLMKPIYEKRVEAYQDWLKDNQHFLYGLYFTQGSSAEQKAEELSRVLTGTLQKLSEAESQAYEESLEHLLSIVKTLPNDEQNKIIHNTTAQLIGNAQATQRLVDTFEQIDSKALPDNMDDINDTNQVQGIVKQQQYLDELKKITAKLEEHHPLKEKLNSLHTKLSGLKDISTNRTARIQWLSHIKDTQQNTDVVNHIHVIPGLINWFLSAMGFAKYSGHSTGYGLFKPKLSTVLNALTEHANDEPSKPNSP